MDLGDAGVDAVRVRERCSMGVGKIYLEIEPWPSKYKSWPTR